jgi:competence protein ComEC
LIYAGWGLDLMNQVAEWAARSPHATLVVASAPAVALPIAFIGILWICLWRGALRWLGLPLAFAVSLWPRPDPPSAWIAADGAAAAIRVGDQAILMRPNDKLFGAELWAHRRGLEIPAVGLPVRNAHYDCARTACRSIVMDAPRLSMWWTIRKPKPAELEAFCASSDILVMKAEVELPPSCADAIVLRPADFAAGGSVEIYPAGEGWRLVWAQPLRGVRPWTAIGGAEL